MQLFKNYILFLIFLVNINNCFSQSKRSANWYFGNYAGLNFISGVPVADTASSLTSIECSATISDTTGNLLFYTNGVTVWNRNHDAMPNGQDILGIESAAQGAICVPKPGSTSLYYLFVNTFDGDSWQYPANFKYSIIDMDLNNGLGDVTASKNVLLFKQSTEELAATKHCNGKDYWIISRKTVVNKLIYHAYLLTQHGLDEDVVTIIDTANAMDNRIGCMTFSQDGKVFVHSSYGFGVFIFDFDNQTGVLTMRSGIPKTVSDEFNYSNAISPDKTKLYVSRWIPHGWNYVSQYDLTDFDIASTRIDIDSVDFRNGSPSGFGFIGALRLASDQKIYVSRWKGAWSLDSIDRINNPNIRGAGCNLERNAVYLNLKTTKTGLPNFVSNFTTDVPATNTCPVLPIQLLGFSAEPGETKVKLTWETAYELNNDHFSIEKSTDAKHFYTIGTIKGNLNSNTPKTYFIYDDHPSSLNYYRLKQFDIDGNVTVSKTLIVKFTGKKGFALLQNPVRDHLFLMINAENNLPCIIKLYDPLGRLIKIFNANNGINELDVSFLSQGTYFLQFAQGKNGISNLVFIKTK